MKTCDQTIIPVVLAGGSGTRLWPLSRSAYPKQFLNILGSESLLQTTLDRISSLRHSAPLIVANEDHRFLIAEQLRTIENNDAKIVLEPIGRNTAPAIALAAFKAVEEHPDPILVVLSADHAIQDDQEFLLTLEKSLDLAQMNKLVALGITPTYAETGYGYIRSGSDINSSGFEIDQFVEKPDLSRAQSYLESGNYFWNSGIFVFKAKQYLDELKHFEPDIYDHCSEAMLKAESDLDFIRPDFTSFLRSPSLSVDIAIMEKTKNAALVPFSGSWSDVGSWSAIWDISDKDANGNSVYGDVILKNSSDSYIRSSHRLVAAVGVQDLVIVETKDALLVSTKDNCQLVKHVVSDLKSTKRREGDDHREVFRPWGTYDCIDIGDRYQVKLIRVNPGAKLSLQMHHHRAEHWVVVSGTAKVINGDESYLVSENESTYIPVGQVHSLENPGVIPLEIIEVQSGSYLGEDDIIRFHDQYGRE